MRKTNSNNIELTSYNFSHIHILSRIFKEQNYVCSSEDYLPSAYEQTHIEDWIYRIKTKSPNTKHFAIQKNGELIGGVSISFKPNEWRINCEISYFVAKKYRNQGVVTRSISHTIDYIFNNYPNINRIVALTYEDNIASRKPLEKNGFKLLATLDDFLIHEEELKNCCIYGLQRDEI